ncbi:MAG: Lrp/AsnC family transcriptional regulator [Halieaceae bacterium]|jgi:Lrp/AsnC family leucine-responsive transcriptional regulator|nr:Lrp/AsnC family transcriptional regulator [Halieaceae bacterium]
MDLDRIDRRLLTLLQDDASLSNLELAERVGLSATPCARRIKRLEQTGIIRQRVALLDAEQLGLTLTAHIGVTMDRHTPERFEAFEAEIQTYPEILNCSVVTGQSADYLLTAVVRDMHHYEQFLLGRLTRIPGVAGVHSSFELRKVVSRTALLLPEE